MKIGFLGFDQFHGKFNIGSSTIRCDWPIRYWPEAERFVMGNKYDVVIYQKAYWIDHMKAFKGIKILDLCDPDWLQFNIRIVEAMQEVDAITCSSIKLAEFVTQMTDKPVWVIPDRVDLAEHRKQKQHENRAQTLVWFGYSHNFDSLNQCMMPISKLGLDMIVISEKPYHPPPSFVKKVDITNYAWSAETVNDDILKGDIVLNPKLSNLRFKYKSDNKTVKSWALGMPVAVNDQEMKYFIDPVHRQEEAKQRLQQVKEQYNVENSVAEYKNLIAEICQTNTEQ